MFTIRSQSCSLHFSETNGGLCGISSLDAADECLKDGDPDSMPFRIYADPISEFQISLNDKYQLVFQEPSSMFRRLFQPGSCSCVDVVEGPGPSLHYESADIQACLSVLHSETDDSLDLHLIITNTGGDERELMVSFPFLDGIRLGPKPEGNLATAMDQAGVAVPAWERPGGVLGEGNQMSMQWHAIWDPGSGSALGMIFMDPDVLPKRLIVKEPSVELSYFPPFVLAPGQSRTFPPARIMVYRGDWRPAARAYHDWFQQAFAPVQPPDWFRRSDGLTGRHFKRGGPGIRPDYGGQFAIESFRDLPSVHLQVPVDNSEYAFYSRGSMLNGVHTDGDNVVREDLGGVRAMREGIEAVHRLGLHTTLYVEGYIVHEKSELARSGRARRWAIVHRDGGIDGPYTKQGFLHMCPGCTEWQDHLARTVSRLLRETGADGVRLDSLGFYYLPCYNPEHHHGSPFGYNDWIKQLLSKVRAAALEVNPNALLTTEGPADWFAQWFHGALTSRCPRDLPLMRLAVGPYRPYAYSANGALWGSISGLAGGGFSGSTLGELEANWLCARFPVHEALVWGEVLENPGSTDPQTITRLFKGAGYWAMVATRPECTDPFLWPWGTKLSGDGRRCTVRVQGIASLVEDAVLCNVETLRWSPMPMEKDGRDLLLGVECNWALIILREKKGPTMVEMDSPQQLRPGESGILRLDILAPETVGRTRVSLSSPGLAVEPRNLACPGNARLQVPEDAIPGSYAITLRGRNVLGMKRLLKVL